MHTIEIFFRNVFLTEIFFRNGLNFKKMVYFKEILGIFLILHLPTPIINIHVHVYDKNYM